MNLLAVLFAFAKSLAVQVGGKTGALASSVLDLIGTIKLDTDQLKDFAAAWIQYANSIVDATRNPTDAEHATFVALADAVRAHNQALYENRTPDPLPLPPAVA